MSVSRRFVLNQLGSTVGSFLLTGYTSPFPSLSLADRIRVLNSWAQSPLALKRKLFRAFKTLTCAVFLSNLDAQNSNPAWESMGYPGPDPTLKDSGKTFYQFKIEDQAALPDTLECDAVIVGSGAGGGVVAGELAKAGYKVIVLEKGDWVRQEDLTLLEMTTMDRMYENGSVVSSEDTGIGIYAGSTFGGGTTVLGSSPIVVFSFFFFYFIDSLFLTQINWSASFRTPDAVLKEWSKEHGLPFFTSPEFRKSADAVCERLGVHDDQTVHNTQNGFFNTACEKLGYHSATIPRNAPGAHSCGWCCYGCKAGQKQGTLVTFLQDASESGNARFITRCFADKIIHSKQSFVFVFG